MGLLSFLFGSPKKLKRQSFVVWKDGSFPMEVVGESNYQNALHRICGGFSRQGHDKVVEACLELEPTNPHDDNAVRITISGLTVGYLPRAQAERVASFMRSNGFNPLVCDALINGDGEPISTIADFLVFDWVSPIEEQLRSGSVDGWQQYVRVCAYYALSSALNLQYCIP